MTIDPQVFRDRLFVALLPVLESDPVVRGVWEGGSVATGRADAFSDIDLCVVAELARHNDVLDALEGALGETASIAHTWRVEPSSFAGVTQRIHLLHDAPPYFMVDIALIEPDATAMFLERERHGDPRVLHDPAALLTALPLDRTKHAEKMQARLAQIRAAWPVYRLIAEKELVRGRALDAIGFYMNGLLRPLLELIGMRHRPERYDFGWRYLHSDLPEGMQRELEQLAYVSDAATLRANLAVLDRLSAGLFAELFATPLAARLTPAMAHSSAP